MNFKKTYIKYIFFFVFIFGLMSIPIWMKSKVPRFSRELVFSELTNPVEVYQDEFGVPRIFAQNKKDLFFALGYIQASERMFQFQLMKRIISGRISEVVGEKGLVIDKYFRTLGFVRNSKAYFERNQHRFETETLDYANAYLEGVNRFAKEGKSPAEAQIMGLEMEPIYMEHILGFVAFMGSSFGEGVHSDPVITSLELEYGTLVNELTSEVTNHTLAANWDKKESKRFAESIGKMMETYHASMSAIGLPEFQGSNSWVVSPKKSKTGKAILSNDPHIAYSNPSIWFEAYLNTPDFEIHGNFLPMIPFAVIGFNQHHAWGLTMFENDDMDFYKETPTPNPNHYLFKGKEYPYEIIEEKILVRGQEPISFQIKSTLHGPLMNGILKSTEDIKFPVALRWSMFDDDNEYIKAFSGFNFAKNLQEFQESAAYLKTPGLNIVYADKEGNIAYFACGGIYEKNFPTDRILDGASGKFEWGKQVPFALRPKKINPSEGYIFTANHKHFGKVPYRLDGYWQPDDRTERLKFLFASKTSFDRQDMIDFVLDDYFAGADFFLLDLLAILEKSSQELLPVEKEALDILKNWDKRGNPSESGAAIYSEFILQLGRKLFLDEFGERRYKSIASTSRIHHFTRNVYKNPNSKWWDNIQTSKVETKKDILLDTYRASIAILIGHLGTDIKQWKWGQLHTLLLKHPLGQIPPLNPIFSSGPRSVPGGTETVNNLMYRLSEKTHQVKAGPSMRMIVDYSNIEDSLIINPLGQSAHRMSSHYEDQAEMFVRGEFRHINLQNMKTKQKLLLKPKNVFH